MTDRTGPQKCLGERIYWAGKDGVEDGGEEKGSVYTHAWWWW